MSRSAVQISHRPPFDSAFGPLSWQATEAGGAVRFRVPAKVGYYFTNNRVLLRLASQFRQCGTTSTFFKTKRGYHYVGLTDDIEDRSPDIIEARFTQLQSTGLGKCVISPHLRTEKEQPITRNTSNQVQDERSGNGILRDFSQAISQPIKAPSAASKMSSIPI